jgi:glycosyltransferase involved in cell wall biosynthesis
MRVMHVVQGMRQGGAETVVVEHARHAGPDVEVLICALNEGGPALDAAAGWGARTFAFRKSGRHLEGLRRLTDLLRAERVDVVNGHNPTGALYGTLAARWAGVPVSFRTEHTVHTSGRHSLFYPLIERAGTALTAHVICVSETVRQSHASRMRWAADRFVTVANGISVDPPTRPREELRTALGLEPENFAILSVGGLRPPKAYHVLLEAFTTVSREHPGARLLMAGDGPLRQALRDRCATLGLSPLVQWLGERHDVGDLLEASDLFALSSEREGLPMALLEAMGHGRAVVVTRVGGIGEAVIEGETGHLVPPHDPAALARAMIGLVRDPGRLAAMGRAARARWRDHFSAGRMVRETEGLYRAALQRRGHEFGGAPTELGSVHVAR